MGHKALLACVFLVVLSVGLTNARSLPRVERDSLLPERSKRSLWSNEDDSWINDTVGGRWEKARRQFEKRQEDFDKEFDRESARMEKQWRARWRMSNFE
ncbi:hypothetical protein AAVH_16939 [Aphelenchoides avenae]|nr:hypothetical protein AAVH_16939 [Aphelenchus avenae]